MYFFVYNCIYQQQAEAHTQLLYLYFSKCRSNYVYTFFPIYSYAVSEFLYLKNPMFFNGCILSSLWLDHTYLNILLVLDIWIVSNVLKF